MIFGRTGQYDKPTCEEQSYDEKTHTMQSLCDEMIYEETP